MPTTLKKNNKIPNKDNNSSPSNKENNSPNVSTTHIFRGLNFKTPEQFTKLNPSSNTKASISTHEEDDLCLSDRPENREEETPDEEPFSYLIEPPPLNFKAVKGWQSTPATAVPSITNSDSDDDFDEEVDTLSPSKLDSAVQNIDIPISTLKNLKKHLVVLIKEAALKIPAFNLIHLEDYLLTLKDQIAYQQLQMEKKKTEIERFFSGNQSKVDHPQYDEYKTFRYTQQRAEVIPDLSKRLGLLQGKRQTVIKIQAIIKMIDATLDEADQLIAPLLIEDNEILLPLGLEGDLCRTQAKIFLSRIEVEEQHFRFGRHDNDSLYVDTDKKNWIVAHLNLIINGHFADPQAQSVKEDDLAHPENSPSCSP